jgi:hypothetical protein
MKMEQTQCFEMLAFKLQTPVNHPEESIQQGISTLVYPYYYVKEILFGCDVNNALHLLAAYCYQHILFWQDMLCQSTF